MVAIDSSNVGSGLYIHPVWGFVKPLHIFYFAIDQESTFLLPHSSPPGGLPCGRRLWGHGLPGGVDLLLRLRGSQELAGVMKLGHHLLQIGDPQLPIRAIRAAEHKDSQHRVHLALGTESQV